MKKDAAGALKLTWEEIGFLCQGMSLASRPMDLAVKDISNEYSLGPRGPWITVLITTGQIYPLDLAKLFRVGRSLITAELTRLAAAGLVEFEQNEQDGRRTELKLTRLGNTVQRRVRDELSKLMLRRLAGYTREELLLCARMLHDFRVPQNEDGPAIEPDNERRRPKAKRVTAPAHGRSLHAITNPHFPDTLERKGGWVG
jgi:DNA-binding MarR family transcriptional regulator